MAETSFILTLSIPLRFVKNNEINVLVLDALIYIYSVTQFVVTKAEIGNSDKQSWLKNEMRQNYKT